MKTKLPSEYKAWAAEFLEPNKTKVICTTCKKERPKRTADWNRACETCQTAKDTQAEFRELMPLFLMAPHPTKTVPQMEVWMRELGDQGLVALMVEMHRLLWRYNCTRQSREFQLVVASYVEALMGTLSSLCLSKTRGRN